MNYSTEFENYVNSCLKSNNYVGVGNPNSDILIIGKEAAIDREKIEFSNDILQIRNLQNYERNAMDWMDNIKTCFDSNQIEIWNKEKYFQDENASNNPLFSFKGLKGLKEGETYNKYQKLHDYIFDKNFNKDEMYSFQNKFFITELNDSPNKRTINANKESIKSRKELFKNEQFIQNFKVIILACSNYISNIGEGDEREIDTIFDVKFSHEFKVDKFPNQKYWVHKNESNSKLVIHTRQLSTNVSDDLLKGIANEVRIHMKI